MVIRFRKSIKLAPGVRWNISGSGSSWSFGPRGASVNIGKRGAFINAGLPGTGLSTRAQLVGGGISAPAPAREAPQVERVSLKCSIAPDGTITFLDAAGNPAPDHVIEAAKKQNKAAILGLIERQCDAINDEVASLGRLHCDTPPPDIKPKVESVAFPDLPPVEPKQRQAGLMDKLVPGRAKRMLDDQAEAAAEHRRALADWQRRKTEFERALKVRKDLVEKRIYTDVSAMETFLEMSLQEIVWPRETTVALDIRDEGRLVQLDVDLPELEDIPTKVAAVPARGLKLSVKDMGATKVQRLYSQHVHGIIFRLVGEAFAALPVAQQVVASGYSQRVDPATGHTRDDYLLSTSVPRSGWTSLNFRALNTLDPVEALAQFDLRRDQTKSGVLRAIEPY